MSDCRILSKAALNEWLGQLSAAGRRVIAPQRQGDRLAFAELPAGAAPVLDFVQTPSSAKPVVFPRYEALLRYQPAGRDWQVDDVVAAPPTVLFGVHPCDAASLATLKAVLTWDTPDPHFEQKLAQLTVVGLACTQADAYCFCTSVGLAPGATGGCDLLLTPLGEQLLVEVVTDKGAELLKVAPQAFAPANGEAAKKHAALAQVPPRFDAKALAGKLPALFDQPDAWKEQSLRCLGCGACAYVCPTCSCFDIQDEKTRAGGGVRLRCWDSCGFGLFTLHASGHNPRHVQSERWRQRVMHKFSYQPERLGVSGCVGCGRCSRACPVDMNLGEHVAALAAR